MNILVPPEISRRREQSGIISDYSGAPESRGCRKTGDRSNVIAALPLLFKGNDFAQTEIPAVPILPNSTGLA
jgi:hypothetical protein